MICIVGLYLFLSLGLGYDYLKMLVYLHSSALSNYSDRTYLSVYPLYSGYAELSVNINGSIC